MTRAWLAPAVPLYAAATALNDFTYRKNLRRTLRLPRPVVSVGGLSAGGSGKTPVALAVCEMLRAMDYAPVVLSRGYGRSGTGVLRVSADSTADACGDEPLMMARTGEKVFVSARRHDAGMKAMDDGTGRANTVFVLDDGFQHRELHRDANIVAVSRPDLTDGLLPAGNLREPRKRLERADILAVAEEDADIVLPLLNTFPRPSCARPGIWLYTRELGWPSDATGNAVAFAGIARPERFIADVKARSNVEVVHQQTFADHHRFSDQEITALCDTAKKSAAQLFVTTEKDAARLTTDHMRLLQQTAPVIFPRLRLRMLEPELCRAQLQALLTSGIANG